MSLRSFHILFILLSIVLALGFSFWAVRQFMAVQALSMLVLGVLSLASGTGLIYYLLWFIGKSKTPRP